MATKPQKDRTARGTAARIGAARLVRLGLQNEKLQNEVRKLKGQVGDIDKFKREVLAANAVVKQQILAVPFRLMEILAGISESREIARVLHETLVEALNDLAYEREHEARPDVCPCCGQKKDEAPV